jgi:hypothetical protein
MVQEATAGQARIAGGIVMAKSYNLSGPIMLEGLTNQQALSFVGVVVNEIPAHSMGTADLNIHAEGPAGTDPLPPQRVAGKSVDELKASLEQARAATTSGPEDIVYDVRGSVNLVGLSFAEGMDLIDTVMAAIPEDSLVMTSMLVVEC